MLRCSACGHQSPPGSSFCLNCGTALAAAPAQTPGAAPGLPVICSSCHGENPPGMKFCRNCGTSLAQPGFSPGVPSPGPFATPAPGYAPTPFAPTPVGPNASPPSARPPAPSAQGSTITCPRCATPTPVGFAYCQQCGLHLNAIAPTDPGGHTGPRIRPPTNSPPLGAAPSAPAHAPAGVLAQPIDPQGATLAADGARAGALLAHGAAAAAPAAIAQGVAPTLAAPSSAFSPGPAAPAPAPAVSAPAGLASSAAPVRSSGAWGVAVLVNRDGSDGPRFPLTSEDTVVGRGGADIAFDEDRFLARQHARIERVADGTVRIHPIDSTNGVFKKTDGSVELADGTILLVGREVLRFEKVTPEERTVHPLVRHGVALFGSPPRDPWGRIVQLIPSGGYRDVRHLVGEEVVLGREEGDIVFRDDAFMSRRHAAITWDGRRALLTDLGSSNGTFVRISGPTTIKNGDHVRMGDQLLRIER